MYIQSFNVQFDLCTTNNLLKDFLIKPKQALQKQKEKLKPVCDQLFSLQDLIDLFKRTNLISSKKSLIY